MASEEPLKPAPSLAQASSSSRSGSVLAGLGGSQTFEMLQLARQQSNAALLGNLRKPLSLSFTDIKVWVSKPPKKALARLRGERATEQEIVHGLSGIANAGEMLALMGPSGTWRNAITWLHRQDLVVLTKQRAALPDARMATSQAVARRRCSTSSAAGTRAATRAASR